MVSETFFPDNTDPSQTESSELGAIGEDDQLPSDEVDKIEKDTGKEMIKNPENPVASLSIVFEKHQDLWALTPSEYDEL